MNSEKQILTDSLTRIFNDHCASEVIDQAEAGEFPSDLWRTLEQTGLTLAGLPVEFGGSGGELEDSLMVIRTAAKYAAPVPLAETFIAARLAQLSGCRVMTGPVTVVHGEFSLDEQGFLSGQAGQVAFARWCAGMTLVAKSRSGLMLCQLAANDVIDRQNMAGEPRDSLNLAMPLAADQYFPAHETIEQDMFLLSAGVRALMMSAALESLLALSVEYALQRQQFGRPIARFQAIQQQLAIMAGEVAASIRAADALQASLACGEISNTEIAIAKSRIGEAVAVSTDIAHQVHGAMGYTLEHPLNHFSRRLWDWRDEFGNERYWQQVLGGQICAQPADSLWATITNMD